MKDKRNNMVLYIFTLLFSFSLVLTYNIVNKNFIEDFRFDLWFFIISILLSIFFYVVFNLLIKFLSKLEYKKSKILWNSKKIFIISLISVFLTGLLFLIVHYPGTCMVDTLHILFDPVAHSNQYPLIYSLLSYGIYHFFLNLFDSMNLAFFLMSLIQLVFMSIVLAHMINWLHKTFKSNKMTLFTILYFNVLTIFANLNTAHLRDTLFAAFILLLITLIHKIVVNNGKCLDEDKFIVKSVIILGLISLVRNNGIYMIILLLICMLIMYKKYFKGIIKIFIGTLLIFEIPNLIPLEYQRENLFQEMIAVPLQQVMYTVKYDELSKDDLVYLNNIMPVELSKEFYNPFCVDPIKWNIVFDRNYLDSTKAQFMELWFRNLPRHFESYVKAYLLNSYDLWSIHRFNNFQSRFLYMDINDFVMVPYYKELKNKNILPESINNIFINMYEKVTKFVNNATCFWIFVLMVFVVWTKNKKNFMLYFIPFLGIWISLMIACPLSSAFRYMSSFGYAFPFMIAIVFSRDKKTRKQISKE